jgi:hypothetical protein
LGKINYKNTINKQKKRVFELFQYFLKNKLTWGKYFTVLASAEKVGAKTVQIYAF